MEKRKRDTTSSGLGDVALRVRASRRPDTAPDSLLDRKRVMLAEFCRLIAQPQNASARPGAAARSAERSAEIDALPPRLRQTLAALLKGDSEKQVARRLNLSPHTIHVYVKSLYRRFNVASRGELLARWVQREPTEGAASNDATAG